MNSKISSFIILIIIYLQFGQMNCKLSTADKLKAIESLKEDFFNSLLKTVDRKGLEHFQMELLRMRNYHCLSPSSAGHHHHNSSHYKKDESHSILSLLDVAHHTGTELNIRTKRHGSSSKHSNETPESLAANDAILKSRLNTLNSNDYKLFMNQINENDELSQKLESFKKTINGVCVNSSNLMSLFYINDTNESENIKTVAQIVLTQLTNDGCNLCQILDEAKHSKFSELQKNEKWKGFSSTFLLIN
jgi:hypothetical protein